MARLAAAFYERDVLEVARDLIGCTLHGDGVSALIVETEAYHQSEPAAHSFRGMTERTRHLFGPPGTLYVYFTYGMHWCANLTCEPEGVGAAVLLRAAVPLTGLDVMAERRNARRAVPVELRDRDLLSGPAKLAQAFALTGEQNGIDTTTPHAPVWIAREPPAIRAHLDQDPGALDIANGPRIGITQAVDLPWRFGVRGSRYLSRSL